ncbi:MAG: GerMN domain-containing protein [Fimbriimonadales bacterium]
MSSRKTKKDTPGAGPLVVMGVLAAVVLGGLIYYVKFGPPADLAPPVDGAKAGKNVRVNVPVARVDGADTTFNTESQELPPGTDVIEASVNGFLETIPAVQPEARLITVKYEGENAELQFSSNFRQTYGTDDESMIVQGIMKAVASNSKVKTVTFTEGGKPIESLGSIDLTGPQSVQDWMGG